MSDRLTEVRVRLPDRPGVLADLSKVVGDLDITIYDLDIAHTVSGDHQALVLVVDSEAAARLSDGLAGRGFDLDRS